MTETPVVDALGELGDSLAKVDAARHTLMPILESLGDRPTAQIVSCVLYTLESAVEHGQASFDIIYQAVRAKE